MRIQRFFIVLVSFFFLLSASFFQIFAQSTPFAMGGSAGVEFPLAHEEDYDPGIAAEVFFRKDPYEIRFHFTDTKTQTYSVVLGMKYFLTASTVRPFIEAAVGPSIIDPKGKGLAYGVRPEASLGVDLGLSRNLSFGSVARYFGMVYFGDTNSGKMEAQHGLDLLFNVILWF